MRLQPRLLTALAVLALLHTPVRAEDTPSNMGPADSGSTRPAADPLGPARNAIAAQQWARALDLLKAQLPQLNRNADLHNLLGFAYRKQARPDLPKAFEHYKLALSIDPRHRGAHEYIGEAYLMNKQPAKAREHLDTLKTLCGGTACEEYQDLAKALAAYRD